MGDSRSTFEYLKLLLRATLLRLSLYVFLQIWWLFRAPPVTAPVRIERICIPSREPGRSIRVNKYTPKSLPSQGPHKVHLNWHGSGLSAYLAFMDTADQCSPVAPVRL